MGKGPTSQSWHRWWFEPVVLEGEKNGGSTPTL